MNHPRPTCRDPSFLTFAVSAVLAFLGAFPALAARDGSRPCAGAAPGTLAESSRVAAGIVVESVEVGSTLAQAGLAGGDLILSWERHPKGPAAKGGAARQGKTGGGAIGSPFDWWWLAAEQAPRGPLTLRGCRGQLPLEVAVAGAGAWHAEVSPDLRGAALEAWQRGLRLAGEHSFQEAAALWEGITGPASGLAGTAASPAASRGSPPAAGDLRCWIHLRLSRLWQEAGDWERSLAELERARLAARGPRAKMAVERAIAAAWRGREAAGGAPRAKTAAREAATAAAPDRSAATAGPDKYAAAAGPDRSATAAVEKAAAAAAEKAAAAADEAALRIAEKAWGDSLELAQCHREMAASAWRKGLPGAARDHWRSAVRILDRLAPGSLGLAHLLANLTAAETGLGELARAHADAARSVALMERLGVPAAELAGALNNLAIVAYDLGSLQEAEDDYRRALAAEENGQPDTTLASILNNLSEVELHRGELDRAQGHLERARGILAQQASGGPGMADVLSNLGHLAYERGNLALAERFTREGEAIRESMQPGSLKLAVSLTFLGSLAADRGDPEGAEELYRRALEINRRLAPEGLDTALCLDHLGEVALSRGQFDAAERLLGEALAILQKAAPRSLRVAGTIQNLGNVAFERGDLAGAAREFRRALTIWRREAPEGWTSALLTALLGEVARLRGDRVAARRLLEEALRIERDQSLSGTPLAATWNALGKLERDERRPGRARFGFERALDALESEVLHLGGSPSQRAAFSADRADYYLDAIDLLVSERDWEGAFAIQERSRGRTLLAQMAERDLGFGGDLPGALREERHQIVAELDLTQRRLVELGAGSRAEAERLLRRARDLRRKLDDLAARARAASPRLAALRAPRTLDAAAAWRALDPGTVALCYSVLEGKTYLFVVAPDAPLVVETLPVGGEELARQVDLLRRLAVESRGGSPDAHPRSRDLREIERQLYAELIAPAERRIEGAHRLLVVPDGPLHLLPWGALVRPSRELPSGKEQYLIEWKPIHLDLSVTLWSEMAKRRRAVPATGGLESAATALGSRHDQPGEDGRNGQAGQGAGAAQAAVVAGRSLQLAAFGDPRPPSAPRQGQDGGAGSTGGAAGLKGGAAARQSSLFEPLPFSRQEVEQIARLFPASAAVYLGDEATEERAKTGLQGARFVHFAAHTVLDERSPLDSAIVLAIPDQGAGARDNGLLQAWEIFDEMRLDADLVVLSGCDSGLGAEVRGEGLFGLVRAFQFAGARSVVASLWKVSDRLTAELMVSFYRHLVAGEPKDEALRAAQLELLARPESDGAAPYFWAAFELSGDWR